MKTLKLNLRKVLRGGAGVHAIALLGAGIGGTVLAAPAMAQDAATAAPDTAADQSSDTEIVVTGSRIARPELSAPNPIQVLSAENIEQSGETNLTEFLADNPALLGSQTLTLGAGSNLSSAQYVAVNLLNLRNLGTARTLVLVDGRRHVAGAPGTASVDVNTIPTDLVERVDVLTGGVSAVYGADGVSGVVNFILKKDYEGVSLRAQNNISQRGDAGQRFISVLAGKNFADGRGNVTASYEFNVIDRFSQKQRLNYGLTGPSYGFVRNPADGPPRSATDDPNVPDRILLNDLRWQDSSRGGAVDLDGDGTPDFTGEGTRYDLGRPVPGSGLVQGGSSTPRESYYGDYLPYLRRHVGQVMARFEFSPAFELFAEGKYVKSFAWTESQPSYDFYSALFADNAYLNQRYGANVVGDASISRDNFDFGQRRYDLDRELFRTVVGAKGDLGSNLNYELSYTFGQSTQRSTNRNDRLSDRYYAALDAVVNPANGQITCRINLPGQTRVQYATSNSSPYLGLSDTTGYPYLGPVRTFTPGQCIPLNILGENAWNPAALDWVLVDHSDYARIRQQVVSGSISGNTGSFFNLPGGPVGFAVGGEYRKESSYYNPSEYSLLGALDDDSPKRVDQGSFDVKEVFGELNVPLLKDTAFFQNLAFGGALRLSDYSTIGRTTTWSVNGTWSPILDVTFRGTYSNAVRAPNIIELFAGGSGSYEFITDPCGPEVIAEGTQYRAANCRAALTAAGLTTAQQATFDPANDPTSPQRSSLLGFQGGNPNLNEETAKTWTAGVVVRPSFISGLSLTADWYNIRLDQAIQYSTAQDVVDLCVDQPDLNNVYCSVVQRSGRTGYISSFTIIPQNVANFRTAGLDATLNYRFEPFANAGTFNLRLVGNYLNKLEFVPTAGADPENDLASAAYPAPKYTVNFDLTWQKGPLQLNYGINYFSRTRRVTREQEAANPDYVASQYIWYKEKWDHELFARYEVTDKFEMYGGINNLFDTKPDIGASGYPISAVGRSFFVGARAKIF